MDKDIGDKSIDHIYKSIQLAINDAQENTPIKITSNLYDEPLVIRYFCFNCDRKPGLILEPKEKGGEVTLQQTTKPCIKIDVGEKNTCTIRNIRMLFKGPNMDENLGA